MNKEEVDKKITLAENRATIERDKEEQKRLEEEKKNFNFTQLDDVGLSALTKLIDKSAQAGSLFLKMAKEMGTNGSIIASNETLASIAGVSTKNIHRLVKLMEEYGLVRKMKFRGARVITLNPNIVWRSWNNRKQYAMFHAQVIMEEGDVESDYDYNMRRANALIEITKKTKGKAKDIKQTEFPSPVGQPSEDLEIIEE